MPPSNGAYLLKLDDDGAPMGAAYEGWYCWNDEPYDGRPKPPSPPKPPPPKPELPP